MTQTDSIDWPFELKQHAGWLKKVLRCRIADGHSVEDVLQDVAVAVFRQLNPEQSAGDNEGRGNDVRGKSTLPTDPNKVAPWLYRVAIRQAVNLQRKRNRQSEPKTVPDIETAAKTEHSDPLQWMVDRESNENVKDAIKQLSDAEREILMLKFTENWSYRKLANHLGISERAVEHRLLKARKQLRSNLLANRSSVFEGDHHESN